LFETILGDHKKNDFDNQKGILPPRYFFQQEGRAEMFPCPACLEANVAIYSSGECYHTTRDFEYCGNNISNLTVAIVGS